MQVDNHWNIDTDEQKKCKKKVDLGSSAIQVFNCDVNNPYLIIRRS